MLKDSGRLAAATAFSTALYLDLLDAKVSPAAGYVDTDGGSWQP